MIFLALVLVIPAHATVIEFSTDKTSYKKGDQIIFSGKTDIAHANKMVSVKVTPPQGKSFLLMGGITDGNGLVEIKPVDTTQSKIRSEEHTSELQSHSDLVCRLLLEKKKYQDLYR